MKSFGSKGAPHLEQVRGAFFMIAFFDEEESMQGLLEITIIIGFISIVVLFAQSMISIDRNLRARQARMREIKPF
jgi:hypothetical protein